MTNNTCLADDLFAEIRQSLVESIANAFSPGEEGKTSLDMWTGAVVEDNRQGSLSLTFKQENDGRTQVSIVIKQRNLKTGKHSTPMAGDYYLDDPELYRRLNETLSHFGGRELSRPVPMPG